MERNRWVRKGRVGFGSEWNGSYGRHRNVLETGGQEWQGLAASDRRGIEWLETVGLGLYWQHWK